MEKLLARAGQAAMLGPHGWSRNGKANLMATARFWHASRTCALTTRTLTVAGAILLAAGLSSAARAADTFEVEYKADVTYGTGAGEPLLLDLATPKDAPGPRPGVILIHGGGWAGGKKDDFADLARKLAARGYVSTTINYRLAPAHLFPAQVEDSKCAVRWMRAHADELHLDSTRLGALGGSAGGHLVMMLGLMDPSDGLEGEGGWPDQSSKVQAVVNVVGPFNLIGDFPDTSNAILRNFLGGTAAEKDAAYRQASPVTYVTAGDAPHLMFMGTKDPLVPFDQGFQLVTALEKAGVTGRAEFLIGAGHGWGGAEMERTLESSFEFFDQHLAEKK